VTLPLKYDKDGFFLKLLLAWTIVNLIQAYFTELIHDEAYYWVYAQNLDWGYFDHPPAIALFIKLGYLIFNNELGVRFLVVLANSASLYLIWKIISDYAEDVKLFAVIFLSVILVHIGGFIAVPDTPLIFFTALFFYLYKIYLNNDSLVIACLIGLTIAMMFYSKYHAVLIIFFTLISNLSLLKRKTFWLIAVVAVLLFLPHVLWQIENGYPSIKYHLAGRSRAPYEISYTLEYILGQILIAGPLAGIFLFYACARQKTKDLFLRSLKLTFWGFLIFFFISSFKGRVEANWTAAAFIPMMILSHIYASWHEKFRRLLFMMFIPSLILLIGFRIFLMLPADELFGIKTEVHGWKKWSKILQKFSNEDPVIFMNSYQYASKYQFYSGEVSYSANNIYYRKNQYNLWHHKEKELEGKRVLLLARFPYGESDSVQTPAGLFHALQLTEFYQFDYLKTDLGFKDIEVSAGEEFPVTLTITNAADFTAHIIPTVNIIAAFEKMNKIYSQQHLDTLDGSEIRPQEHILKKIKIKAPEEKGRYSLMVSLQTGNLPQALQGEFINVEVK
jgi:hypothetical protein